MMHLHLQKTSLTS